MHPTFKPCLDSIVSINLPASIKFFCVPVSSHATPLLNNSTCNEFLFKYKLFKSVISNSPLFDGLSVFDNSTT